MYIHIFIIHNYIKYRKIGKTTKFKAIYYNRGKSLLHNFVAEIFFFNINKNVANSILLHT